MKRIAIIDDEENARNSLRLLINTICPGIEICGEANSVESGYVLIRQTRPHVILLDISMEDGTGFDLLDKFPNPFFQVIFTTAHDEFALKAFRYHALDYLLKPINPVELCQTIDRVEMETSANFQLKIKNLLESYRSERVDKITLSTLEGMVFLRLNEIVRIESEGNYTSFYLTSKERHMVARPMKDFEELLVNDGFFKLHQSHIVNLFFVKKILREDGGYALMEDGCKVPVARRRKEEFLKIMRE